MSRHLGPGRRGRPSFVLCFIFYIHICCYFLNGKLASICIAQHKIKLKPAGSCSSSTKLFLHCIQDFMINLSIAISKIRASDSTIKRICCMQSRAIYQHPPKLRASIFHSAAVGNMHKLISISFIRPYI